MIPIFPSQAGSDDQLISKGIDKKQINNNAEKQTIYRLLSRLFYSFCLFALTRVFKGSFWPKCLQGGARCGNANWRTTSLRFGSWQSAPLLDLMVGRLAHIVYLEPEVVHGQYVYSCGLCWLCNLLCLLSTIPDAIPPTEGSTPDEFIDICLACVNRL